MLLLGNSCTKPKDGQYLVKRLNSCQYEVVIATNGSTSYKIWIGGHVWDILVPSGYIGNYTVLIDKCR